MADTDTELTMRSGWLGALRDIKTVLLNMRDEADVKLEMSAKFGDALGMAYHTAKSAQLGTILQQIDKEIEHGNLANNE